MIVNIALDGETTTPKIEERVLDEYRRVLDKYVSLFRRFDATCNVRLSWKNSQSGIIYDERPIISDGYHSYVTCTVYNASGLIVESLDHDMYMDFAWGVSVCKNRIMYIDDSIDDDLFSAMESCLDYFNDPY